MAALRPCRIYVIFLQQGKRELLKLDQVGKVSVAKWLEALKTVEGDSVIALELSQPVDHWKVPDPYLSKFKIPELAEAKKNKVPH